MTVTSPTPPTADDLVQRLREELRAVANRRKRANDESICLGDEVECDLITLVDGELVPGGIVSALKLEMRELPHLPGLVDQMVNMCPNTAQTLEIVLPSDYPRETYRALKATVYVEVRKAWEVEEVKLDDLDALDAAGLGATLEEAMDLLATRIDEEQGAELLQLATDAVLETWSERLDYTPSADQVEQELLEQWEDGPGAMLASKPHIPEALKNAARDSFLCEDIVVRREHHRQKKGLALAALIEQENVAPTEETMLALLEPVAEAAGVGVEEMKAALRDRPQEAEELTKQALQLAAIEVVMAAASIEVLSDD